MSVTLRDVAKRCGLSPSTVSGILNNRAGTWASAETRQRVREAAEALGYRPNHAARALRTGRTHTVSLVYHVEPSWTHHTFDSAAEIVAGLLGMHGYVLNLHVFPDRKSLMAGLSDMVRRQSCDVVFLLGRESDVVEQGQYLEEQRFPFVVKGRLERQFPHWYQVDYDHEGMMRSVVQRFAQMGHRRIAYVGYSQSEVYQTCLYQGFRNAFIEAVGQQPDDALVYLITAEPNQGLDACLRNWFSLPEGERPTAVAIGAGDNQWRAIERLLASSGRVIGDRPGDVAVAGQATSNLYLAYGQGLAFTDISYASIAELAVRSLILPLLEGNAPEPPVQRILPGLIPTKSLGLPRLSPGG